MSDGPAKTTAGAGVLVAGATGALGGLVARELAGRGVPLCLTARDARRLEGLAGELGVPAVAADLTDPGEPGRVVDEGLRRTRRGPPRTRVRDRRRRLRAGAGAG